MNLKSILVGAALICGAALPASALTPGRAGLGLNLGVAPCLESHSDVTNVDLGVKLQYNFSRAVRGELAFDYGFKDNAISCWTLMANFHYVFNVGRGFEMYPVLGLGFGQPTLHWGDGLVGGHNESLNRFALNVGIGGGYRVASNVTLNAEVKYQYMEDFSRMPILLGVTYYF